MKSLIEFKTGVYPSKEYQEYVSKMYPEVDSENPDANEDWYTEIHKQEAQFPSMTYASIFLDPNDIVTAIEVSSLKEVHENPDNPKFDSMELFMREGVNIQICSSKKEFLKKLKDFGITIL
jgi:hypothetical protein